MIGFYNRDGLCALLGRAWSFADNADETWCSEGNIRLN